MAELRDRVALILVDLTKDDAHTPPFEVHAVTTSHHRVVLLSTPHAVATLLRPLTTTSTTTTTTINDDDDDAALRASVQREFLPLLRRNSSSSSLSSSGAPRAADSVSGTQSANATHLHSSLLVGGNVGARDLFPDFSPAVPGALLGAPAAPPAGFDAGGGMLVGPGAFRAPARRLPGGGAIVPGARFDPIGPGGGLRAPRRGPPPGEQPPGFEDEHHMLGGGGGGYDDMFI